MTDHSQNPSDTPLSGTEAKAQDTAREPMLNVPPVTLALTCLLLLAFIAWEYMGDHAQLFLSRFIFMPIAFTNDPIQQSYTLVSYALLHFNWSHLVVNATGLLAFGSGIERMMGKRYITGIFIGGAIIGVLGYWIFYPQSPVPLIGASAGISALFGAVLPLIVKRPQIMIASIIFIVINIILGMLGLPNDPMQQSSAGIAWQAHIAGFLFGEFLTLGILRWKIAQSRKKTSAI